MDSSTFRERAGIFASWIIIGAYVAIGFVDWWGKYMGIGGIAFDAAWTGSMNGLAGGALGYLIGKQSTNPIGGAAPVVQIPTPPDATTTTTVRTTAPAQQ